MSGPRFFMLVLTSKLDYICHTVADTLYTSLYRLILDRLGIRYGQLPPFKLDLSGNAVYIVDCLLDSSLAISAVHTLDRKALSTNHVT